MKNIILILAKNKNFKITMEQKEVIKINKINIKTN
jgi:hypothetical protein